MTTLGEFIASSIGDRSRTALAKQLGVSRGTLHSWMHGDRTPSRINLGALARELGWTDADVLMALALARASDATKTRAA